MPRQYLEFENPIKDIDEKIAEKRTLIEAGKGGKADLVSLEAKRKRITKNIFSKLSRWERVQVARHPERPFSLEYFNAWSPDFIELHGDRYFADDSAVVTGIGKLEDISVAYIGQQKGRNTKNNINRNFGMMRPDGYRKALRIMKLAEKYKLPVISLIDTPGAYPGIGAEERGQGEAIANNLLEMAKLETPIISVVIGEGASGGALGIGICDRMLMLENTWYSVISPEGCASILWRDRSRAKDAAEALKLTPKDLEKIGICDRIVQEPIGGAHRAQCRMYKMLKGIIIEELAKLKDIDGDLFLERRIERYDKIGDFVA